MAGAVPWRVIFEEADGQRFEQEVPLNPYNRPDALEFRGLVYTYVRQDGLVPIYRAALRRPMHYPETVSVIRSNGSGGVARLAAWLPEPDGTPVYRLVKGAETIPAKPADVIPDSVVVQERDGSQWRATLWTRRASDNRPEYRCD